MKSIRNSSGLVLLAFFLMIFAAGCKSKKKAMEASNAAAEKAKVEQAANLKRQQQEEELRRKQEADEAARRDAEARAKREAEAKAVTPKSRLSQYFDAVASSSTVASANSSINEALTLFASGDTPVLIVISEENGQKDYDRPTTINAYLNYLKDQKKNLNRIENLQFNSSGKITEVELRNNTHH